MKTKATESTKPYHSTSTSNSNPRRSILTFKVNRTGSSLPSLNSRLEKWEFDQISPKFHKTRKARSETLQEMVKELDLATEIERISPVRHQFRRRKFLCVDGDNRGLMPWVLELDVVEIGLETECESRLRWQNSFFKSNAESKHSRLRPWAWSSSLMDRYHPKVNHPYGHSSIWRGIHRGPRWRCHPWHEARWE